MTGTIFGLGGAARFSIPAVIKNWSEPTAISQGTPAFVVCIIVFWLEAGVILAALALLISPKKTHFSEDAMLASRRSPCQDDHDSAHGGPNFNGGSGYAAGHGRTRQDGREHRPSIDA